MIKINNLPKPQNDKIQSQTSLVLNPKNLNNTSSHKNKYLDFIVWTVKIKEKEEMCTHERPERDNKMLDIGVVETCEKIETYRDRERENGVGAKSRGLRRDYSNSSTSKYQEAESD